MLPSVDLWLDDLDAGTVLKPDIALDDDGDDDEDDDDDGDRDTVE